MSSFHRLKIGIVAAGFFAAVFSFGTPVALADHGPRILFLSSYHPAFASFFQQLEGVKQGLSENGFPKDTYVLDVEFMDSKRFFTAVHQTAFKESLILKLESLDKPYDLIIAADDRAIDFVRDNRAELFPELSAVFLALNNLETAKQLDALPWITGVVEEPSIKDTLLLIARLMGTQEAVNIIVDPTPSGQVNAAKATEALKDTGMIPRFLSLGALTFDELNVKLRELPANSPVLLLDAFRDRDGNTLEFKGAYRRIRKNFDGAIFHLWEYAYGDGVIGGTLVSHFEQGRAAASKAAQILAGTPTSDLPVRFESPNIRRIDARELERLALSPRNLPADTQLDFVPKTYLERFAYEFSIIAIVAIIFFSAITLLIVFYTLRLRATRSRLSISEARFRDLAVLGSDWFWETDHEGTLQCVSPRFFDGTSWAQGEAIGQPFLDALSPSGDQPSSEVYQKALAVRDEFTDLEFEHKRSDDDDASRYLMVAGTPVFEKNSFVGYRGVGKDVTSDRLISQELLSAKLKAEASDKAKSEFMATMSHELRTPLNAIIGFSEMISMEALGPLGHPDYKSYASSISVSGHHLYDILTNILELAMADGEHMSLRMEPTNFDQILEYCRPLVRQFADRGSHTLTIKCKSGLRLKANPLAIRQVLLNLVSNACKYTPDKGRIDVSIDISSDDAIQIVVRDTGIGIPSQFIDYVRKPFTRMQNHSTADTGGTGIGLALCDRLVGLHHGHLDIESVHGEGTTVTVTLPRLPSADEIALQPDRPTDTSVPVRLTANV